VKSLWRVSNHCDLSGLGGEKADGRWHTAARGKRIVYLSEHPALALIENMANLKGNPALFPGKYQLLEVEVEDDVVSAASHIVEEDDGIPRLNKPLSWTQDEGDSWLKVGNTAFAVVPSFPAPFSLNFLFNPLHPDASRVRLGGCHWLEYDQRLFKIRS
jgi:RES domain-containing protein